MTSSSPVKPSKKKGRALPSTDALPDLPEPVSWPASELLEIAPQDLVPSPFNPRKRVNQTKVHELATSMRLNGWFGSCLGRRRDGALELVFGHQRRAAAILAGVERVRVEIIECSDQRSRFMQLAENMARGDLTPLEEAEAFQAALDAGADLEEIAAETAQRPAYVRQRLSLNRLAAPWRAALEPDAEHPATLAHAQVVAPLREEDQLRAHAEFVTSHGREWDDPWTAHDLARFVREQVLTLLKDAPWETHDAGLLPEAGACTSCPKRTGAAPDLFGAFTDDADRCLDGTCFSKKREALLEQARARAVEQAKGRPVLEVTNEHFAYGEKRKADAPITRESWRPVVKTNKCDSAAVAVIVDGDHTPTDFARVVNVCTDKACKQHWQPHERPAEKASKGAKAKQDPKAAEKQAKDLAKIENMTLTAVLDAIGKKPSDDDLRLVAMGAWEWCADAQGEWLERRNLQDLMHPKINAAWEKAVRDADRAQLHQLLVELVLIDERFMAAGRKTPLFAAAVKRLGVDPKKVLADAKEVLKREKAEFAAKAPPAKEAPPAKATKKAPPAKATKKAPKKKASPKKKGGK